MIELLSQRPAGCQPAESDGQLLTASKPPRMPRPTRPRNSHQNPYADRFPHLGDLSPRGGVMGARVFTASVAAPPESFLSVVSTRRADHSPAIALARAFLTRLTGTSSCLPSYRTNYGGSLKWQGELGGLGDDDLPAIMLDALGHSGRVAEPH